MTASLLPSPKPDFWTFWPTSSKLKWEGMKVLETIKLPEHHEHGLTDLKKHLHSCICRGRDRPLPAATHPLWQHWDNPSHHTYSPITKPCLTQAKAFWPSRAKGLCTVQAGERKGVAVNSLGMFRWQRTHPQRKQGFIHLTEHQVTWEAFPFTSKYWPTKV